jgi:hypothetical protein
MNAFAFIPEVRGALVEGTAAGVSRREVGGEGAPCDLREPPERLRAQVLPSGVANWGGEGTPSDLREPPGIEDAALPRVPARPRVEAGNRGGLR